MGNINDIYFDGFYKEIWKTIIPDELTVKEVDFMVAHFGLQPGSKVLDLMCGYGRHAIGLGRKGIHVTAIDNLPDYTREIGEITAAENLPVKVFTQSILEPLPGDGYDLAICMGNSLNFFNEQELSKIVPAISAVLKKGSHLLINSWTIAEIVCKHFKENGWSQVGNIKFLTSSKFLFHPARVETDSFMIAADGVTETKKAVDYVYSLNETDRLLRSAGLTPVEEYSIPGRKKFTLGEPRIYIIAEK
ncbi:MAG: class I SAM-dependent methyltransferase [Chitinophagaceae bacterium]